jgi:hypothetical protein
MGVRKPPPGNFKILTNKIGVFKCVKTLNLSSPWIHPKTDNIYVLNMKFLPFKMVDELHTQKKVSTTIVVFKICLPSQEI